MKRLISYIHANKFNLKKTSSIYYCNLGKIKFIIKAKKLGFTLQEIKQLFSNALDPEATCNDIADIALAKIEQIDQQIYELSKMKELLNSVSIKCDPSYSIQECPIINSLMQNIED
jgi:DNA-binding transcriptional MerR regulator